MGKMVTNQPARANDRILSWLLNALGTRYQCPRNYIALQVADLPTLLKLDARSTKVHSPEDPGIPVTRSNDSLCNVTPSPYLQVTWFQAHLPPPVTKTVILNSYKKKNN